MGGKLGSDSLGQFKLGDSQALAAVVVEIIHVCLSLRLLAPAAVMLAMASAASIETDLLAPAAVSLDVIDCD